VSWGTDRIDLFVRQASDSTLFHDVFVSGGWGPSDNLGGVLAAAPAVASWTSGRLDIFVRGGAVDAQSFMYPTNLLYRQYWNGGPPWSGWLADLPQPATGISSAPSAVSWGSARIDIVFQKVSRSVGHDVWSSGWQSDDLGGVLW
jgi:hypothetical protein